MWYLSDILLPEEGGGAAFNLGDFDILLVLDPGDLNWLTLDFISGDFIVSVYRSVLFSEKLTDGDRNGPADGISGILAEF